MTVSQSTNELYAREIPQKAASAKRAVAVSFVNKLDDGELLNPAVTPTVDEIGTTDLTIANQAVSTAPLTISGETVAAGGAVQFTVDGGVAGKTYLIRVRADTDATPAQTNLTIFLRLKVQADDGS